MALEPAPPTIQGTSPHARPYPTQSFRPSAGGGGTVTESATRRGESPATAAWIAEGGVRAPRITGRMPQSESCIAKAITPSSCSSSPKHARMARALAWAPGEKRSDSRMNEPMRCEARCSWAMEISPDSHAAPMARSVGRSTRSSTTSGVPRKTTRRSVSSRPSSSNRTTAATSAATAASYASAVARGGSGVASFGSTRSSSARCARTTSAASAAASPPSQRRRISRTATISRGPKSRYPEGVRVGVGMP